MWIPSEVLPACCKATGPKEQNERKGGVRSKTFNLLGAPLLHSHSLVTSVLQVPAQFLVYSWRSECPLAGVPVAVLLGTGNAWSTRTLNGKLAGSVFGKWLVCGKPQASVFPSAVPIPGFL